MSTRWLLPACLALALAACGKHEAPPPKPAPAPAKSTPKPVPPPVATPAVPAFRVTAVTLGTMLDDAYAVTLPTTQIPATIHTVYASVATTGSTRGATLAASWHYLEGQDLAVNETSQKITTDGPATTAFKLYNPNRWPAGYYRVDILLNGKIVAHRAFEVIEKK